jgi:inactivated superfamily I helicase
MIQGLQASVTASELRDLCLQHALQHQSSIEQLTQELADRRKSPEERFELEDETSRLIDFHKNKVTELHFFANHLETHETYRLSREDLCFLGVIRPDHDFTAGFEDSFDEEIPF